MKKIVACLAGGALMLLSSAAFGASEDLSYGIALKGWYNSFKLGFIDTDPVTGQRTSNSFKATDSVLMLGPSASLSYKNFFTGITYLTSVSDWDKWEINGQASTISDKVSRDDLDVLVGYRIIPQLGIVTGYKGIWMEDKFTGGKQKWNKNGGVLGLTGNYMLPFESVRISLYGNAGYLVMHEKVTDTTFTGDVQHTYQGFAAEAGAAYNIIAGLSVSAGYKIQGLYSFKKKDETTSISELYDGFTFGVDYRF